uniref:Uncharacterized protein n=1 Tax=Cacopsylla melanoneura TaxID=428564 RepID=A0A8D8RS65_9HEMI
MTKWRTHRRQANFPLEGGEKKGRRRRRSMKRKRKKSRKRKRRRKRRRRRKKRLEKDEDIVFLHFLQDVLRNLVLCSILNHLFTLIEYEIEIYLVHLTWDSLNPLVFVFETYPRPVLPDENIKNPYAEGKNSLFFKKKNPYPLTLYKKHVPIF